MYIITVITVMTIKNYNLFADKIIDMIYENDNVIYRDDIGDTYNDTLQCKCHKIGHKIYRIGGAEGLFAVMNIVEEKLLNAEYSNQYLCMLREIEWSWSGICDEWQA